MVKLDKDKFKGKFSDWWSRIEPAFHLLEPIYDHLKTRKAQHFKSFPKSENTFRAFTETPYKDVRMIWMGQCPYHTIYKGEPIADGLCFSVGAGEESPSLKILYDAIENDTNQVFLERPLQLDYLAKQGILMLNSSLTTEQGVADKHKDLWEPFMRHICANIFDSFKGMPIIAFGTSAKDLLSPYMTDQHLFRHVYHPAYYARKNKPMDHEGVFTWANDWLERNNGPEFRVEYNYHEMLPF